MVTGKSLNPSLYPLKYVELDNFLVKFERNEEGLININNFDNIKIKLCDFGFSKRELGNFQTFLGSQGYYAPEIGYHYFYTSKVDIFSLGLCFYKLFKFALPHTYEYDSNDDNREVFFNGEDFENGQYKVIIDLIQQMTDKNIEQRLDHDNLLNHEFFTHPPCEED